VAASSRRHKHEFSLVVFSQRHYYQCLGVVCCRGSMAHPFRLARHPGWLGTCRSLSTVSAIRNARGYYGASSNQCLTFSSTWTVKGGHQTRRFTTAWMQEVEQCRSNCRGDAFLTTTLMNPVFGVVNGVPKGIKEKKPAQPG
jgi:hypothetical protein